MEQCLTSIISNARKDSLQIQRICRIPSEWAGSYAAEVVIAQLISGTQMKFFLKNYGVFRRTKNDMELRRLRELHAYKDLLPAADLGTATYYGNCWNTRAGRFWILLEFVGGLRVRYCDLEHWIASAAWLGRLHGHFLQHADRLRHDPLLQIWDAAFYKAACTRAWRVMSEMSGAWAGRLESLLNRYDQLIPLLVGETHTLVHGSYGETDVLIDTSRTPARICPVDWELAGYGNPLSDFAYFTDGFDPPLLLRMWEAYQLEATKYALELPSNTRDMQHIVDCFCLHRRLNWLGQSLERQWATDDIVRVLNEVERLETRAF